MKEWIEAFCQLLFPEQPQCCLCKQPFQRAHFRRIAGHGTADRGQLADRNLLTLIGNDLSDAAYAYKLEACLSGCLCQTCLDGVNWITSSCCRICGRSGQCQDCIDGRTRKFLYNRSAAVYDGTVREMIHQFKYRGQRHIGELLADIMLLAFEQYYNQSAIDLLVPVPLHDERLAERGFNQSLNLCRRIADKKHIPIADVLVRTHATRKQSKKAKWERTRSMRGVFQCAKQDAVQGKRVLLVDDVYTTGATADACAAALRSAEAAAVYVLTMAR